MLDTACIEKLQADLPELRILHVVFGFLLMREREKFPDGELSKTPVQRNI